MLAFHDTVAEIEERSSERMTSFSVTEGTAQPTMPRGRKTKT